VDHEVTVELKNDIQIRGTLKSVDQYLNIKLDDITVVEEVKYPHLVGLRCGFLRFSIFNTSMRSIRNIYEKACKILSGDKRTEGWEIIAFLWDTR
jgi:small nuclear ribonucleoprotein (snRNP)-like protein